MEQMYSSYGEHMKYANEGVFKLARTVCIKGFV